MSVALLSKESNTIEVRCSGRKEETGWGGRKREGRGERGKGKGEKGERREGMAGKRRENITSKCEILSQRLQGTTQRCMSPFSRDPTQTH
jgi:hypothetical protein